MAGSQRFSFLANHPGPSGMQVVPKLGGGAHKEWFKGNYKFLGGYKEKRFKYIRCITLLVKKNKKTVVLREVKSEVGI